jgi:hypothetical protein
MIFVNGKSLDIILDQTYPEQDLYGLVPSVTWLFDEIEQKFAIDRFMAQAEGITFVPLLICPDDGDFSCTTLIVEVEISGSLVYWRRMGIDYSDATQGVGSNVKWLNPVIEFRFNKAEYDQLRQELMAIADCA